MSENIIRHENVVVACIDVLGFRSIVLNDQSGKRTLEILKYILRQNSLNSVASENNSKISRVFWASEEFADSVYLIGIPSQSLKEQLFSVSAAVMILIAAGICGKSKFAVRAGISSGIIWETEIDLLNEKKKTIIMGPAMINAHQLEKSQNWLGGAVSIETEEPIDESYLVGYNVPVKTGCAKPKYALNWPKLLKQNASVRTKAICGHEFQTAFILPEDPEAEIKLTFESTGSIGPFEKEKLTNTLLFWDFVAT